MKRLQLFFSVNLHHDGNEMKYNSTAFFPQTNAKDKKTLCSDVSKDSVCNLNFTISIFSFRVHYGTKSERVDNKKKMSLVFLCIVVLRFFITVFSVLFFFSSVFVWPVVFSSSSCKCIRPTVSRCNIYSILIPLYTYTFYFICIVAEKKKKSTQFSNGFSLITRILLHTDYEIFILH